MSDITRELCRRIVDVGANDISDAAFGHAATLFLDGLAVASAGADAERGPTILAEHIRSMGSHPHASLIGFDFRCSAPQAAYLNGT
ncbi:MAG: MmgE/PrpD family protein, partial [Gammaproteobacteria bacterium]|nr:MmgE/PrpD family protein [Gammaproteobacteria bacterium]